MVEPEAPEHHGLAMAQSHPSRFLGRVFRETKRILARSFFPRLNKTHHEPIKGQLDIFDVSQVQEFLQKREPSMLRWTPADAESGCESAARVVLGILRDRPEVRRRFPTALSDGPRGSFFLWFCETEAKRLHLSQKAIEHVRGAFASDPGHKPLHAYLQLPSLQKSRSFAVTPSDGQSFLKWFLKQGRQKYQLKDVEVLWFFQCAGEDPWPLLRFHYLVQPEWQTRFPGALAASGIEDWAKWLREEHGLRHLAITESTPILRPSEEFHLLTRRSAEPDAGSREESEAEKVGRLLSTLNNKVPRPLKKVWAKNLKEDIEVGLFEKPGVNVIGHFCYPSGLQRAACQVTSSLKKAGYQVSERDQPAGLRSDTLDRRPYMGLELFDITLSVVAPFDPLELRYQQNGLPLRSGAYRIGIWYWELEQFPPDWIERAASMQELWAPSRFIANAMRRVMPVPVFEISPSVEIPTVHPMPRAALGVEEEDLLFLFMFDMCSIMERKNPLGLIRAFRSAFDGEKGVKLVIKVSRGSSSPEEFERLRQAAADAGVILLDRVLTYEETQGLLSACDVYVSLHRSEGFGLTLAEAMLLGKPVIATNYSGNLDFTTSSNSLLVDYELVPITEDFKFYGKGNVWANPSIDDAAAKMRWVFDHQVEARGLGETARRDAQVLFSVTAAGHRMSERLQQIRSSLPASQGLPSGLFRSGSACHR